MSTSNIPENFDWLNHIIEMQNRDNNRIATSGFTPWVLIGAFVTLVYLLLTGLNDIVSEHSRLVYFIVSFAVLSNFHKSLLELFNTKFRKDKLTKIHRILKNELDKKYFWLGKPFETAIIVLDFGVNLYSFFYIKNHLILKLYFGLFALHFLLGILFNIVYFLIELFTSGSSKKYIEEEIQRKHKNREVKEQGSLLWLSCSMLAFTSSVIAYTLVSNIKLINSNIIFIVYSFELYALIQVIEFAIFTCIVFIRRAKLRKLETKIIQERLNNEEIEKIMNVEIFNGSNLDDFFD